MITKAEEEQVTYSYAKTIDHDALYDEVCDAACRGVEIVEGVAATRGHLGPDGPVVRDVSGPVLKTREVEVRIPIWPGGSTSVEGGYGVKFYNPSARVEGNSIILNYEVAAD